MELIRQVVSLELAKKMKELGAPQYSVFAWRHNVDGTHTLVHGIVGDITASYEWASDVFIPTYTVAELGEMLPTRITEKTTLTEREHQAQIFYMVYDDDDSDCDGTNPDTCLKKKWIVEFGRQKTRDVSEANARAKMWIYLKENNLI